MTPTRLVTEAALAAALEQVPLTWLQWVHAPTAGVPEAEERRQTALAVAAKDLFAALPERPALDVEVGELVCPWCGAEGYDNAIRLEGDPIRASRCASCWNDIRTETIHERLSRERA